MPSPVETILTAIGIPAEDVTKIVALPADDATFDAKPYTEKVAGNYKTQLQNDPNFFNDLTLEKLPAEVVKKVESAQFQRSANIMKGKLMKGLGFTEADLVDLTDEEKDKLENYVTGLANRFVKTKAGDKQIQQELIDTRKKLEAFDGIEEKLKTKFQTESDQKINSAIFSAALLGELSSISGLKIAASDIARTASEVLLSKYGFERVGEFGIELRNKTNPTMKVLKDGTSHEKTLKDALKEIATERGWIAEDDGEGDDGDGKMKGSGKIIVKPGGGKLKMVAPHLQDKISKKIAAEQ